MFFKRRGAGACLLGMGSPSNFDTGQLEWTWLII